MHDGSDLSRGVCIVDGDDMLLHVTVLAVVYLGEYTMNTYIVVVEGKFHKFILGINAEDKDWALRFAETWYKNKGLDSHLKNGPVITIHLLDTELQGVSFYTLMA